MTRRTEKFYIPVQTELIYNNMQNSPEKDYRCVLSGEKVTKLGSKNEALDGEADGFSTDIGIISAKVLLQYQALVARSRAERNFKPLRKKVIEQIDGVPSKKFHEMAHLQGQTGIPPFDKNLYFRSKQPGRLTKDETEI